MPQLKPFAFVLMPFAAEFDDVYKLGVQAVAAELGVVAERVDEQIYTETMLERIYRQIEAADFVIADMTGRNPNVFYEVGYAHARGKLCTLITRDADDIPFDLKHHRHLVYGGSLQNLRAMLSQEIAWLKDEVSRRKTAVLDISVKSSTGYLAKREWAYTGELELVIDVHNKTSQRSPEIEAAYFYTGIGWTFTQANDECPSTEANLPPFEKRHFLKFPVPRLSPGAWVQLRMSGRKTLWSKFRGDEAKDQYHLTGRTQIEIVTSEGNIRENIDLNVEFTEVPF